LKNFINICQSLNNKREFDEKSAKPSFTQKFAEFETEPQSFYAPRVFLEVWNLFTIERDSNFCILRKFLVELTLISYILTNNHSKKIKKHFPYKKKYDIIYKL